MLFFSFVFFLLKLSWVFAGKEQLRFRNKPLNNQETGLSFQRFPLSDFGFLENKSNAAKCSVVCARHFSCRSFYAHDAHCVFGLRDDVTELGVGNDVTPDAGQTLMTRGNICARIPTPQKIALSYFSAMYVLVTEVRTWHDAKQHCESLGGHLMGPRTEELVGEAVRLRSVSNANGVWIGGSDEANEGRFVWNSDGAPVDPERRYWHHNQPDNSAADDDFLSMTAAGTFSDRITLLLPSLCAIV